jgi:DNA-binding FrmR family transcriptional regulator
MDAFDPLSLAVRVDGALFMDKKVKKKTHVLQQRIQTLRQQLAGARKQMDDPAELKSIEQQLAAAEAELAKVKN